MSKLPLQVKIGIRDYWDHADTPVQKSQSAVKELLGIDVKVDVPWDRLISHLEDFHLDKSTLVPLIAGGVNAFFVAFRALLDNDANLEWTDILLERVNRCLRICIGVMPIENLSVIWDSEDMDLYLLFPSSPIQSPPELEALFKTKLLHCFDEKRILNESTPRHRMAHPDDWAELSMDGASEKSVTMEQHQHIDVLPDIKTLLRPDELLLKPPYHLAVYGGGKTMVEVQCSHSPTLELLADYLKKWCKINHQDTRRPPAVEVQLHQSSFSFGLTYDRLTMSVEARNPHFLVSPMIALSFVEGVLGYKSVSVDGSSWIFRKDVQFRRSER